MGRFVIGKNKKKSGCVSRQKHHLASPSPASCEPETLRKNTFGNISKSGFLQAVVPEAATFSTKTQYHGKIAGQIDQRLRWDVLWSRMVTAGQCCHMPGATASLTAASLHPKRDLAGLWQAAFGISRAARALHICLLAMNVLWVPQTQRETKLERCEIAFEASPNQEGTPCRPFYTGALVSRAGNSLCLTLLPSQHVYFHGPLAFG